MVFEVEKSCSVCHCQRIFEGQGMKFSVIVPTCDRTEDLAVCLDRLAPGSQTFEPSFYEVIVTDDGLGRESRRMVGERFSWAVWLQGPRRGPAANRNRGAAEGRGEWLVFVDDDCLPESSLLEEYARVISKYPEVNVFEGKTVPLGNRKRLNDRCPENLNGGNLWSCNFSIKTSNFLEIGGFDERFLYPAFEDIEFSIRLQKSNLKILFCEKAVVFHPWRKEKGFKFWFYAIDSLVFLLKKHPEHQKHYSLFTNVKILIYHFFSRKFILECFSLKGNGVIHELIHVIYIFTLKVYKINILKKNKN